MRRLPLILILSWLAVDVAWFTVIRDAMGWGLVIGWQGYGCRSGKKDEVGGDESSSPDRLLVLSPRVRRRKGDWLSTN